METSKELTYAEKLRPLIADLLKADQSGHDALHVYRVEVLAADFARSEGADEELTRCIALLHDCDDYKLFGMEAAENLSNTRRIMKEADLPQNMQEAILEAIGTIGYSKRLKGITPNTLEAICVSDADMCDALGANGIIRSYQYALSKGNELFDPDLWPRVDLSAKEYQTKQKDTVVNHCFEKLLKLKGMMLSNAGRAEALNRHAFIVLFLRNLFMEERNTAWLNYLNEYLKGL